MPKRPSRIKVVIDTNVFVANFLTTNFQSLNRRAIRLWMVGRRYKLAISAEIQEEYLRVFGEELSFESDRINRWDRRFADSQITERVNLGARLKLSRDPEDNIFIATATSARAKFLITNDRDLLDIAHEDKRKLKFKIVTPKQFLDYWEGSS